MAGILVPEDQGGSGLGLLDAAVAAQSLGWGVAPVPFLGSAVMAPVALVEAGTPAQQERWLPRLATGECCMGIAATELDSRREGAAVSERDGRLHGKALMVIDAVGADNFLVPVGDPPAKLVGAHGSRPAAATRGRCRMITKCSGPARANGRSRSTYSAISDWRSRQRKSVSSSFSCSKPNRG